MFQVQCSYSKNNNKATKKIDSFGLLSSGSTFTEILVRKSFPQWERCPHRAVCPSKHKSFSTYLFCKMCLLVLYLCIELCIIVQFSNKNTAHSNCAPCLPKSTFILHVTLQTRSKTDMYITYLEMSKSAMSYKHGLKSWSSSLEVRQPIKVWSITVNNMGFLHTISLQWLDNVESPQHTVCAQKFKCQCCIANTHMNECRHI